MACELRDKAIALFTETFGEKPSVFSYAPGRVNFIGEHTDYCEGFVCPLAIHYGTAIVGRKVPGKTCRAVSANMEGMIEFPGDATLVRDEANGWINYVAGVAYEFITKYNVEFGFEMAIASDVPLGSGLSSSASLEVAVSVFLEQILDIQMTGEDRALLCQQAEHDFPHMPCGVMDQFISSCGVKGNLLLIDCRSNKGELVPMTDSSVSIIVCNSNKKHQLTGSEYPDRVKQCKEAVAMLQAKYPEVKALRDATVEQVESLKEEMGDVVYRRAIHVVSECQRCLDCKEALAAKDYKRAGQLLYQSHESLKNNFEVSTPEIDTLVEIASQQEGVFGARITGGGFGGCIVCFVKTEKAEAVMEALRVQYKEKVGLECTLFVTTPAHGARVIPAEGEEEEKETEECGCKCQCGCQEGKECICEECDCKCVKKEKTEACGCKCQCGCQEGKECVCEECDCKCVKKEVCTMCPCGCKCPIRKFMKKNGKWVGIATAVATAAVVCLTVMRRKN